MHVSMVYIVNKIAIIVLLYFGNWIVNNKTGMKFALYKTVYLSSIFSYMGV